MSSTVLSPTDARKRPRPFVTRSTSPLKVRDAEGAGSPSGPVPLHRRLFFPTSPPPPLFQSPEYRSLDAPTYELLALVCRAHILPWYGKMTRDTGPFLLVVVSITTHVLREVERRLSQADILLLMTAELPAVVHRHLRDYESAKARTSSTVTLEEAYHRMHPHPAISLCSTSTSSLAGDSLEDPATSPPKFPHSCAVVSPTHLRLVTDLLLDLLLPTTDVEADAEVAMIRDLVVNLGFGTVFGKVAQPWFLRQLVIKLAGREKVAADTSAPDPSPRSHSTLQGFFLWLQGIIARSMLLFVTFRDVITACLRASVDDSQALDLAFPTVTALRALLKVEERPHVGYLVWILEALAVMLRSYVDRQGCSIYPARLALTVITLQSDAAPALLPSHRARFHCEDPRGGDGRFVSCQRLPGPCAAGPTTRSVARHRGRSCRSARPPPAPLADQTPRFSRPRGRSARRAGSRAFRGLRRPCVQRAPGPRTHRDGIGEDLSGIRRRMGGRERTVIGNT